MKFFVGLAYSNIQNKYNIPAIIVGVKISANSMQKLQEQDFIRKERIIKHVYSLAELSERAAQVRPYIDKSIMITKENVKGQVEAISGAYLDATKSLFDNNMPLIDEGIRISYRKILATPNFVSKDMSIAVKEKLLNLAQRVEAIEDANDYPFQIARLLARLEYERIRFDSVQFVNKTASEKPGRYFQFYKMSYQRTFVEDFVDNFVSLPELVLRKSGGGTYRIPVKAGRTYIDFQPVARFCRGTQENGWIVPCEATSEEQPYGNLVFRRERCDSCREKSKYVECLSRKPHCNGTEVTCGNKYFAGEICNGEFGLYVTRYADSIKVGQAFLPNLISRLLDQGANSALLIYPVSNIEKAYKLENMLKAFLEQNIDAIQHGINEITLSSPKTKCKIGDFLANWERTDRSLLLRIADMLENSELKLSEEKIDFSMLGKKISCLLANYVVPPFRGDVRIASLSERLSEKIVGYRGSVIFLENKTAIDMKRLQGYVLRGKVKCQAN